MKDEDLHRIYEKVSRALQEQYGFNPRQVYEKLKLYELTFQNSPVDIPPHEIKNYFYLSDYRTQAGLVFNIATNEIRFIDKDTVWVGEQIEKYLKSDETLDAEEDARQQTIQDASHSQLYQDIKPVIRGSLEAVRRSTPNRETPFVTVVKCLRNWKKDGRDDIPEDVESIASILFETYQNDEQ